MDDKMKELDRIQKGLLAEDQQSTNSVDEILNDKTLNALLQEEATPAFDDPDKIHDPDGDMVYNNFANDYGNDDMEDDPNDEKSVVRMLIGACLLCLGLIAVMGYWLAVLP